MEKAITGICQKKLFKTMQKEEEGVTEKVNMKIKKLKYIQKKIKEQKVARTKEQIKLQVK